MQPIIPFLWYNTNAEEAVAFYQSIFEQSRILSVKRNGKGAPGPEGAVMLISFELNGQQFIALNGGPHFTFNEAVSFVVSCKTQREIDHYWERLTEGGSAGQCGWLKDKFGVSWQVVPTDIDQLLSSDKAMQAMMKMSKLEIEVLKQANKE
ncbi:VOC family protein [Mucilaginibacter sp. RS28]|uniref:VOC family protein n=1 Tax=Mucilaginibacter straminoryzae TaxID=2932774 RepID=A0A9X1X332_9SPHI|nr:VOC family protein [Mucilaginibacter straminoryzae]MCJ8208648.1 VOC family protein [Mucilaginibacter straminoryzae]